MVVRFLALFGLPLGLPDLPGMKRDPSGGLP
jgi:hypothetical protein